MSKRKQGNLLANFGFTKKSKTNDSEEQQEASSSADASLGTTDTTTAALAGTAAGESPRTADSSEAADDGNDTDSKTRKGLRENSLSSLLFVDLNGPPLERFDPAPFITSWINSGHRLSTSRASGPTAKEADPRPVWSLLFEGKS